MQPMPVGIDIAKHIIQVHYVDDQTGEVVNKPLKRDRFLAYFANRPSCLIGMEACGGAHHWARQLLGMGHQVKLMPGAYVKAFNLRHKNDMADAQAIWCAVQQPSRAGLAWCRDRPVQGAKSPCRGSANRVTGICANCLLMVRTVSSRMRKIRGPG